jgi:hypothetical protein
MEDSLCWSGNTGLDKAVIAQEFDIDISRGGAVNGNKI